MSPLTTPDEATQWRRSNWTTFYYCLIVALGAVLFGLDQAAIGGVIVIREFEKEFGDLDPATGTYSLSAGSQTLLYGLLLVGAAVASVVSGPLGTRYGRKAGLYCCAVTSLLGPVVQIVATTIGIQGFGRVISGAGIGFAANFCGTYWTEITPARYRGFVIMLYQGLINVAAFVGAGIIQGVHNLDSKWAWRTPLMVMMTAPLLMLCLIPSLPETPRWYITRGRHEDARKSLGKLRGSTWPPEELDREIDDIAAMYTLECSLDGSTTYRDCFCKTNLRRTGVVIAVALAQSFTGISFIAGYGTLFFSLSGVSQPFLSTVIADVCGLAGSIVAFPLVWIFGRRPLLLAGAIMCGLCMLLFAIIGVAIPQSTAAVNVLVACVCVYLFAYGATWGPVPLAVVAEVPSNGLRSKTISMATTLDWLAAMFIACGSPYLVNPQYANIGVKLGFIFGGCLVVSVITLYFVLPETKDRTLEEIDEMFLNRLPARSFKGYICTGEVRDGNNEVVATVEKQTHVVLYEST